jgi:Asp-tRNA(Asn)/Glu-tRNA(Gln) amidotransferase A subunit family amidase
VTGFKPTHGLLSMEGVLPLSKSLDTLGFFTHRARDMAALWNALGHPVGRPEEKPDLGAVESIGGVDPAMATAFQNALSKLRGAGIRIQSVDIAGMLAELSDAATTVMNYEGARFHEQRYRTYGDRLDELANLVRAGLEIPDQRYLETIRFIESSRDRVTVLLKTTPVILTPAAVGPAPMGLAYTGDARMNAPWTALGTPAISIPMPISSGLPVGLQLTAARGDEGRLLRTAVSLERHFSGDS